MGHDTDHDQQLRELLAEVHRPPAPSFERLWAAARKRARPAIRRRRRAIAAAVVATAAALLWAVVGLRDSPPTGSVPAELLDRAHWSGPLDFLLETPGSDLLRSTPRFAADGSTLPAARPPPIDRRSDHET